ncbi:DNA repair protein RadC [Candidatus Saccharibacteria bacterium]|nr:MAG: DNA repair protein RadC [Candidatus Saccharibacteria bacterium]
MKLQDRQKADMPREKLAAKGPAALSDLELIMAQIGSGNAQADVTKISRDVKKLLAEKGSELTYEDLCGVTGLGPAKITQFMAAFELWRRQFEVSERPIIDSTEKVVELLKDIRDKKQEYFVCLSLDGANRLIAKRIITIGTLTGSLVHPREVFADAITDRAASVIVAHNHPSGSLNPSAADLAVTQRLREAAELLGLTLLDHLIVTKNDHKVIS